MAYAYGNVEMRSSWLPVAACEQHSTCACLVYATDTDQNDVAYCFEVPMRNHY